MTAAMSPFILTPTLDQKRETMRQKMAMALMMQGSSGEPVRHWTQALARVAQGGLGGYMAMKEDQDAQARENKISEALGQLPGLTPSQAPAASVTPSPQTPPPVQNKVVAALAPQTTSDAVPAPARPAVMPSPKVWGDQEAVNAGLYPPNAAPQNGVVPPNFNQRFAGATQPMGVPVQTQPVPPSTAPPQRNVPTIPVEEAENIKKLLANPETRPIGMARYQQLMTPKDQMRPLTDPAERAQYGIGSEDKTPYQIGSDNKVSPINPQPFQVNVNQQAESEFAKEAGKHQAARFNDLAAEGRTAQQMMSDIGVLRDLGTKIETGKAAEIKSAIGPWASALGVDVKGLDEIQAYEAVVNRLAPNLRVKGSGAQSDMELRNFLKSLPSLGNQPGGNEIIQKTLEGLYQNKLKASEIGANALDGTITRREAEKQLRELPDPMEGWRQANKASQKAPSKDDLKKKYGLD